MRKELATLAVVVAASLVAPAAHAQQDSAGAEALFQSGHQLFEQKRYAEACPKFAESFRLDPVSGSLLALAACHEADGKLATAWAEYIDVATRARREGKDDRADAAQQRAAALEPKLAKLTIALGQGAETIPGLQVKRDGIVVGPGTFGTPLPVDRGDHTIEATAPDRAPYSKRVTMLDGAAVLVPIPALSEIAVTGVAPVPPPASEPASEPQAPSGGSPVRTLGLVTAGLGVVTAGVGGYFGIQAVSKNSDSNASGCKGDVCTGNAKQARLDARSAGDTSTVLFVVGGLLAAGGVVMFIVGGPSSPSETKPAVAAAPVVGAGAAGFAVSGRF